MKTVLTIAAALLSTATLVAASPAQAAQGYDQYRRTVLGDTTVASADAGVQTRTVRLPGSYAQYLINNGADKSAALIAAAHTGEQPVLAQVAVQAKQPRLTAAQAYAKSIGNEVRVANEPVTSAE